MAKRVLPLVLLTMLLCLLSGCLKAIEELYAPPEQSSGYYDLQAAIQKILAAGAEYCAPLSGTNQQAVQLADLDGDGEEEAIVFVKSNAEMPLKAYLFDKVDGTFQVRAVIEGNGSSFERVDYIQLDGVKGVEMVIGWQVSNQVTKAITVYSLRSDGAIELMSENYTQYKAVDLDADGLMELFLLRYDAENRSGVAELYAYRDGIMEREPEATLSADVGETKRIVTGNMIDGVPAVFVASLYEESYIVTDIFAMKDGTFTNVAAKDDQGMASTVRNYYVYATDIEADGLIELPNPVELMRYNSSSDTDVYWAIEWYNLTLDGERIHKQTTYHNYSGGWYLTLLDEWKHLTVFRGNDVGSVHGYVFALWDGFGEPDELFTIYAFTGDRRGELAVQNGRMLLAQKGEVTYSVQFGAAASNLVLERLQDLFHYIKVDWNSGEM